MPGVPVDDTYADPTLALPILPHSTPAHLSHLRHYIPVFTSSVMPGFHGEESPPSQLSPLRRPACLNVTSLPDMHADDGNSLEAGLLLQLSPASTAQWACSSASPTTISALSALRQFLPSNFEEDEGGNAPQMDMYSCDDFRMYEFKVRRCMRGRSHDWTECPFAHPGEKARRRDPRRFHYSGTACAEFRRGSCKKGDSCEYAHGVFECWLHPTRYRTQPCKDGRGCRRRICFFAHTPDQLRLISQMSSPPALSSPTSPHFEAFEVCGSSSPFRSPSRKASSPLCRMAMEVPSESYSSPASFSPPASSSYSSPASFSPPASSKSLSMSSPMAPINWSTKGVTAFALPAAAMLHPSTSLSNQTQASFTAAAPMQCGHWERQNLPMSHAQGGSKSALPLSAWSPSYTAASTAVQRADDLMCFLKQADLIQDETDWRVAAGAAQPAGFLDANLMLQPQDGAHTVGETPVPTKKGVSEEMLIGHFCDDEEEGAGPKLERVESGKGLRAQIFQSLLSSSQPSCRTYQDSNSEPLRSSSSLGF